MRIHKIAHGLAREFAKLCENCGGIGGYAAGVKYKYPIVGKNRYRIADEADVPMARRSEEIDAVSYFLHGNASHIIASEEGGSYNTEQRGANKQESRQEELLPLAG